MAKSKKFSILLFNLVLVLASFLFVACGGMDLSNTTLTPSVQYIELFVGESKNLTLTIENPAGGMSKLLQDPPFQTNDNVEIKQTSYRDYSTIYTITGKEGGNTSITFTTVDGAIKTTVDVLVRKYSDTLEAKPQALFVTEKTEMIPSKEDFKFNQNASERELVYHFFGVEDASKTLALEDVTDISGEHVNEFVNAKLISQNGQKYLIFTNSAGQMFTIAKNKDSSVKLMKFLSATVEEGTGKYLFETPDANHAIRPVEAGEKFVFVAEYKIVSSTGEAKTLSAEKTFSVFNSIVDDENVDASFERSYTYRDINDTANGEPDNSVLPAGVSTDVVTFVPYYSPETMCSQPTCLRTHKIDFLTAYVKVRQIGKNPLLQLKAYSENSSVVTGTFVKKDDSGDDVFYWYKLQCATGNKNSANYIFHFFYEGYENSDSSEVSFKYKVPVEIRNIPNTLFVNNLEYERNNTEFPATYTFYNNYVGNAGWVPFRFIVNPTNAEYDSFVLNFGGSQYSKNLEFKYINKIYNKDNCSDFKIKITDPTQTVYIKGLQGATELGTGTISAELGINFAGADTLKYNIKFNLQAGATAITVGETSYEDPTTHLTQTYDYNDGISIDLANENNNFLTKIWADEAFQSFTAELLLGSGEDIVEIHSAGNTSEEVGGIWRYYLNLNIVPKKVGEATYVLTLDNGVSKEIKIKVVEALKSAFIDTKNENNLIKIYSDNPLADGSYEYYLFNGNKFNGVEIPESDKVIDFQVYSNGNKFAKAIDSVKITSTDWSVFSLFENNIVGDQFKLKLVKNGSLKSALGTPDTGLVLIINGFEVTADFRVIPTTKKIALTLHAYDFVKEIQAFSVKQEEDGTETLTEAQKVSVYSGISNTKIRQTTFDFEVAESEKGYIFWNQATGKYETTTYDKKYIYWEVVIGRNNYILSYPSDPNMLVQTWSYPEGDFTLDVASGRLSFMAKTQMTGQTSVTLLTHLRQYGKTFTYSTKIEIKQYIPVQAITPQSPIKDDTINLSALKPEYGMLFIPQEVGARATNPRIGAHFVATTVEVGGHHYTPLDGFFTEEDKTLRVVYDEGSRRTYVSLSLKPEQIQALSTISYQITGKLYVYAMDWRDENGFTAEYLSSVSEYEIRFENGTEANRFTIESAEDVANMANNLSSHYQLSTTIDISSLISEGKLPLGNLSGSIVGTSDYAKFTGLNFASKAAGKNSIAMFEEIKAGAYIENLGFEGFFDIASADCNVAMVANYNYGTLTNINVRIKQSRIHLYGNFGGVVSCNFGTISQDFSKYDKYQLDQDGDFVLDGDGNKVVRTGYQYIYDNCSPKPVVYFDEMMQITVDNGIFAPIGGVAGLNILGSIQRIHSLYARHVDYYGYSNYFAFTQITATGNYVAVGGLVGQMASGGVACGIYGSDNKDAHNIDINAPEKTQLIVGGEVSGAKAGGIVGTEEGGEISFVTTRVLVRGNNIGLVGNISTGFGASLSNIRIEAVDDGRYGYNSSMGVARHTGSYSLLEAYFGKGTAITNTAAISEAISYLSRTRVGGIGTAVTESLENTKYYGDFISINNDGSLKITNYHVFASASEDEMKIEASFDNAMTFAGTGTDPELNVMYAFKFGVDSFGVDGLSGLEQWEDDFNQSFNTLNTLNPFYPFSCSSKEVTFISNNPDILTISENGTITIKKTGLVYVQAISILNSSSDGVGFYIYVTDYINKDPAISIIYPSAAKSAIAVDQTTIALRGENVAMLYVRPQLEIKETAYIDQGFTSDAFGVAKYQGILFNMSQNDDVSIQLPVGQQVNFVDCDYLDVTISGQTIYIQRKEGANIDRNYVIDLSIQPILACRVDDLYDYQVNVNKNITELDIDYRKGAVLIENERYNAVPIYSSKPVEDILHIKSTSNQEFAPYYQITDSEGNIIQTTLGGVSDSNCLFTVSFRAENGGGSESLFDISDPAKIQEYYSHIFNLEIRVNKASTAFANRYNQNIYGDYTITFYANSNIAKSTSFELMLRQTGIASIPIENYTKLSEAVNNLPSKSDKAYPGETGVLAITVSPVDADFDSVVIENAAENYSLGNAHAVFGLLSRKTNPAAETNIFVKSPISGAQGSRGIEIRLNEIIKAYNATGIEPYDGVIYIYYDFSSENVLNDSVSTIVVKFKQDGQTQPIASAEKELTIKLQQFVGIELVGKSKIHQGDEYYSSYNVARGLRYELQINSYGYKAENIQVTSDDSTLGEIIEENGKYYLQITSQSLIIGKSDFTISAVAKEEERSSSSKTLIKVKDFVLDYHGDIENPKNPDIVKGMGNGIINVQVGTQITFAIDLYKYIEFDQTNEEVIAKIDNFHEVLSKNASWIAYTNLSSDEAVNTEGKDPNPNDTSLKSYQIGYQNGSIKLPNENYYFKSDGLNVLPIRIKNARQNHYYFELKTGYSEQGTNYTYATSYENATQKINITFTFNVFVSSSEESPIPVSTYEQFIDMQKGAHYILVNDIRLQNTAITMADGYEIPAYTPKEANFASLDGNGYTVHFEGEYDFGNKSELGVFSSIEDGTVIKNLNVNFKHSAGNKKTTITTSADTFRFGGLAATNSGVVTNCYVFSTTPQWAFSTETTDFVINAPNAINSNSFIAGLIESNSGSITNSSVRLNISSTFYISGVVSVNSGKIAATAFRGGKLLGNATNQRVSGFVYENAEDAQIITSFVSGDNDGAGIYSKGAELTSTQPSAGFAYSNKGIIKDCYSDIAMEKCSARNAGFTFINAGTIRNSFSLSRVKSNNEASAGFVMQNNDDGVNGTLENCYYYYDSASRPQINVALAQVDTTYGIVRLTADQFKQENLAEYFEEYSYTVQTKAHAVWFYSTGTSGMFKTRTMSITEQAGEQGSVLSTNYNTETDMYLPAGRIELVSANIYTFSRRLLDEKNQEVDPETGDVVYHYLDDQFAPNRGSLNNPRLIATAKNMEDLISESTSANNFNNTNYRIIDDINYNNDVVDGGVEGYSKIHNTVFAGVMEGNGMTISNIGLASMDKLAIAGMFAQVGYSVTEVGSVKNLTIIPREVAFNSSSTVGTVAGVLQYGYLYDIAVLAEEKGNGENTETDTSTTKKITVTGQNFVGGVVGRAIRSYEIKDVYSTVNASAGSTTASLEPYNEDKIDMTKYSYAGSIAGYLGTGKVNNAHISGVSAIMGGRSGFAYGGLGAGATTKYTFVDVVSGSEMRAYQYGGYIAGETAGAINYAHVNGTGQCEATFIRLPKAAYAVGGVAGKMLGGTISHAIVDQEFQTLEDETDNVILYVGGIVGVVQKEGQANTLSYITDSIVKQSLASCATIGGAVGFVTSSLFMDSVGVKSDEIKLIGEAINPCIGGLIGAVDSNVNDMSISNSYSLPKLVVNTHSSGVSSIANVGGFIGNLGDSVALSMRACYTTSQIDATVYDDRVVGDALKYNPTERRQHFGQRVVQSSKIIDVYFVGSNASGSGVYGYTNETQNYVDFKVKAGSVAIGLSVTQYGMSSIQYVANQMAGAIKGEQAFYGLFGAQYSVKDSLVDGLYVRQNLSGGFTAYDKLRDFLAGYQETTDFKLGSNKTALVKNITADMLKYSEFEPTSINNEEVFDGVYRDVWYYINTSAEYNDANDHAWLDKTGGSMYLRVGGSWNNPTTIYKWLDNNFVQHERVCSKCESKVQYDISANNAYWEIDAPAGKTKEQNVRLHPWHCSTCGTYNTEKYDGLSSEESTKLVVVLKGGQREKLDLATLTKEEFLHNNQNVGGVNYGENLIEMPKLFDYKVNLNDKDLLELTKTAIDNGAEDENFPTEVRFSECAIMTYFKDDSNNIYRSKFNEHGEYVYENISAPEITLPEDTTVHLEQVWLADPTGKELTVLYFENHLDWLNKL